MSISTHGAGTRGEQPSRSTRSSSRRALSRLSTVCRVTPIATPMSAVPSGPVARSRDTIFSASFPTRSATDSVTRAEASSLTMTLVEVEIDQAGKAPGRGDLYPVREDRDPDVVAGHRVGAVDDGVDDRLHPRLPRDDVNGAEASVRLQGPTTRTPLVDERESGIDDVGIAPSRRRSPPAAIVCLEPTPVSSAWYRSTRTRAWGRDSWGCSPRSSRPAAVSLSSTVTRLLARSTCRSSPAASMSRRSRSACAAPGGLHADRRGLAPHGCRPPGRRRVPARLYGSMEIVESPARTKASPSVR